MSQTAKASPITVTYKDADSYRDIPVKYTVAMLWLLLTKIQAPAGEYQFEFYEYDGRFSPLTQRHMQLSLMAGDRLKVQVRTSHGNAGAMAGFLNLPAGVQVHSIFRPAAPVLRVLNEDDWQEAVDSVASNPRPEWPDGTRQVATAAGAAVTWTRAGSGPGVPPVPATPVVPRFRETTASGGPLVASTAAGSTARNGLVTSSAQGTQPNERNASMNAPMTDPTPLWVELLKRLLKEAKRGKEGLVNNAGVGKKATQFFPGKSAHELAPSVFPELRKRGWVRLVNREEGLYQVEQSFVDEHRLDIKLDVMPALEPLPRGTAAHKKHLSPAEELAAVIAARQHAEERVQALIFATRDDLEAKVAAAVQAKEQSIAAAERALEEARTDGEAVVERARQALADHVKKFAKELKTPPSKK